MTEELKQQLVNDVSKHVGARSLHELSSERDRRLRGVLSVAHRPLQEITDD
jgi:hypothetical protein